MNIYEKQLKAVLSIAGSDSSGGAGIQADIKAMTMNGVFAMSAITALTAQNTTGVFAIMPVSPEFLIQQIDAVFTDIRPDAVKIGMLPNAAVIEAVACRLDFYKAKNIVTDPVMVSTSGSLLTEDEAIEKMKERLLPASMLITPNIPEAEVLSGMKIYDKESMQAAAEYINKTFGCAVLLKGGHNINDANDLLYNNNTAKWFYGKRIDNPNTHGTGCTLSSTITANLAKGFTLEESVARSKEYISGALSCMLNLGQGSGPLNHAFALEGKFAQNRS